MSQVLDEHIEYLTLPNRNDRYREAIESVLSGGDKVADLGCGVGVLGLFCLESGAGKVWGIDHSDAIYLARETMQRAGVADSYQSLAGSTFRTELPEKMDMIVCDHVGFFGFDYGIIAMMRDAARRMLKPGGKVMPQSLDLKLSAISSDNCRDVADAWNASIVPAEYRWLNEQNRNVRHHCTFAVDDIVSEPISLGNVELGCDGPELYRFEGVLKITKAGRFDGLGGWFNAHLGGGVQMTNSPLAKDSIQRSQAFLPANETFEVEPGDEIRVTLRFRTDVTMIAWTIQPPARLGGGAKVQRLSTFNSTVLTPADLVKDRSVPLALSQQGEARAFVLAQVDGKRSSAEIVDAVIAARPDMFPTESEIQRFVIDVLSSDCAL